MNHRLGLVLSFTVDKKPLWLLNICISIDPDMKSFELIREGSGGENFLRQIDFTPGELSLKGCTV